MNFSKEVINKLTFKNEDSKRLFIGDLKSMLTSRQIRILELKFKGHTNVLIADTLDLCPATITKEFKMIRKLIKGSGYWRHKKK